MESNEQIRFDILYKRHLRALKRKIVKIGNRPQLPSSNIDCSIRKRGLFPIVKSDQLWADCELVDNP
jgi:hypothetical protein